MRPDLSVLLLTTLIGVGQGLFLALFTVELYGLAGLLPPPGHPGLYVYGSVVALAFLAGGLVASFFHLGRPERAWRAAARWRTSWLSREVIVLPALMGAVLLYGALHAAPWQVQLVVFPAGLTISGTVLVGIAGTLLAFALFVCTGMIYASVAFLREWASPLTVLNFTLMGGASGFTLAAAFAVWYGPPLPGFYAGWALILTVLALAARVAALVRNRRLRPKSTLQTALGIKHPRIVQKAQGFMGGSFNTREFSHGRPASRLTAVRWSFLVGAFALPVVLLAAFGAGGSAGLLLPAFAVQYAGLLAERWFFFAEANHPQNIYYQAVA
jgi:DMSO reductase anchor subunit